MDISMVAYLMSSGYMLKAIPDVKKVIFSPPATIIIWEDGTKTVVKCCEDDNWDPEKGFMAALLKKILGKPKMNKLFDKYVSPQLVKEQNNVGDVISSFNGMVDSLMSFLGGSSYMNDKPWDEAATPEE